MPSHAALNCRSRSTYLWPARHRTDKTKKPKRQDGTGALFEDYGKHCARAGKWDGMQESEIMIVRSLATPCLYMLAEARDGPLFRGSGESSPGSARRWRDVRVRLGLRTATPST